MKRTSRSRHPRSRAFALALTLMLVFSLCCPAASASAESYLSTHKDEIADAIETVRSNLESLGDDIAAIQEEVKERIALPAEAGDGGETDPAAALGALLDLDLSDIHDNNPDISVKVDSSRFNNNVIAVGRGINPTAASNPSSSSVMTTAPKTGDVNNLILWIVIVAVSALALATAAFFLLRKNKKKKK